jgi:hypothetical protein
MRRAVVVVVVLVLSFAVTAPVYARSGPSVVGLGIDGDNAQFRVDRDANPLIFYDNSTGVRFRRCNDPLCEGGDDVDHLVAAGGRTPTFVSDTHMHPIVAYVSAASNLVVKHCRDRLCALTPVTTTIDGSGDVGPAPDLWFVGGPHPSLVIAYVRSSANEVRVTRCNDFDCTATTTGVITTADRAHEPVLDIGESVRVAYVVDEIAPHTTGVAVTTCSDASCSAATTTHVVGTEPGDGITTISHPDMVLSGTTMAPRPVVAWHVDGNDGDLRRVDVALCGTADCATHRTTHATGTGLPALTFGSRNGNYLLATAGDGPNESPIPPTVAMEQLRCVPAPNAACSHVRTALLERDGGPTFTNPALTSGTNAPVVVYTRRTPTNTGFRSTLTLAACWVPNCDGPSGRGYVLAASDGGVFTFGDAKFFGSAGNLRLRAPIVDHAVTTDGNGYWLAARDGGVFTYGDAKFVGSAGALPLTQPIVAMAPMAVGQQPSNLDPSLTHDGYWLAAADGGVFNYGDAQFHGSAGGLHLTKPVVGIAATRTGRGYWLVASDGGIFNYGDAQFHGSAGALHLTKPIVAMTPTPTGRGYWLVASDGGVFDYGDARFFGSAGALRLRQPIVDITATPTGHGYWLTAADGGIFTYGDATFRGSLGAMPLTQPIVSTDD